MELEDYIKLQNKVDLHLDCWPYTGGTTTAYAIEKSLPTITLSGKSVVENQSSGILKNIGFLDTIVNNVDDYVRLAVSLRNNPHELNKLKSELKFSALNFIENQNSANNHIENLLLDIWKNYCLNKVI